MIQWLIQQADLRDGDNVQRLSYAVEELGMAAHVVPFVPWGAMDYSFLPAEEPLFVYGSVVMVRDALERAGRRPTAYCSFARLRCSTYFPHYAGFLLQDPNVIVSLGDLRADRERLFAEIGEDGAAFVRPDENDKAFDGEVVFASAFERFWNGATRSGASLDTACVVARPRKILQEWRVVVADRRVVTASQYRREGSLELERGAPDEVTEFAQGLARAWSPDPIFVMDVARTREGLQLIEIGSVNCCGLYACDVRAFVGAVRDVVGREG